MVLLKPKKTSISKRDFENYSKFTQALFQHKNKKIRNALIDSRHIISDIDKKELKTRLREIDSDKINDYLKKRVVEITTGMETPISQMRKLSHSKAFAHGDCLWAQTQAVWLWT